MAANSKGPRADAVGDAGEPRKESAVEVPKLPKDLTAAETEDWVAGDKARAQVALEAENKRDNPRSTVVSSLERLAKDETGAGVASDEA